MSDNNDWGQPDPDFQRSQEPQPEPLGPPNQAPAPGELQQTKIKHSLETNDIIPIVLSFFIPGAGHIMAGQVAKGAVILVVVILTCGIGYALNLLVVADCFFLVQCKKDRPVGDWEFFPDYNRYI